MKGLRRLGLLVALGAGGRCDLARFRPPSTADLSTNAADLTTQTIDLGPEFAIDGGACASGSGNLLSHVDASFDNLSGAWTPSDMVTMLKTTSPCAGTGA